MTKHTIVINGNSFNNLSSFYEEVEHLFTKDLDWKLGHSLDALNDILYGGFGVYEPNEEIKVVWQNIGKSKKDLGVEETKLWYEKKIESNFSVNKPFFDAKLKALNEGNGQTLFDTIIEIFNNHKHIELVTEA